MNSIRASLKRLPEPLKQALYRWPIAEVKRCRAYGFDGYLLMDRWARQMEAAVLSLTPVSAISPRIPLWFLTGERFWYQTAFCAWTFSRRSGRPVSLNLVDDGTLHDRHVGELKRLFGEVNVITKEDADSSIETHLPEMHFPVLHKLRRHYPHIRKITDVHVGNAGPRLVLDSDMLFFADPSELLQWIADGGQQPIWMEDVIESYGYPRSALEELAGGELPARLNVGICGMRGEWINWQKLEWQCDNLITRFGNSYFLEQALVAMLATRRAGVRLPRTKYIVMPERGDVRARSGVLHHYVAGSKRELFRDAWRSAML